MAILITGGAGFIGSNLADRLLACGHEVVALDNFDPYYSPAVKRRNLSSRIEDPRFRLVEGDVRAGSALERARTVFPSGIDAIVHLAARAGVRSSGAEPELTSDVNIGGLISILEFARSHDIAKLVFASSSSVYGERGAEALREDDPTDAPLSPYAATKIAGEVLCRTHQRLYGTNIICLRLFSVYGPRQRPEMAIHRFTRSIERGEEITLFGNGEARRDYTFVDDVVSGIRGALRNGVGPGVFNVGSGRNVTLLESVRRIEDALGKRARICWQPALKLEASGTLADISRTRSALGYQPRTHFQAGIERFVKWYRDHGRDSEL